MKYLAIFITIYISKEIQAACNNTYGYSAAEQIQWTIDCPECGGKAQSPIEIKSENAVPTTISPLLLNGYDRALPSPLRFHNDGKTVNIKIDQSAITNMTLVPYISGGNINGTYLFEQISFHWGKSNDEGAEHVIDSSRKPLELQIQHRNIRYSASEAASKPDGFVNFGVLYNRSIKDGLELYPILNNLDEIRNFNSTLSIRSTFSLASLLGRLNREIYYAYKGSLTHPPCSESITWFIFSDTLSVSNGQLNQFRRLFQSDGSTKILNNYRLLQPLNDRRVLVRQIERTRYN